MKDLLTSKRCHVAVIGAGAAGLVAARECLRQGFEVRVFESSGSVGGVWVYQENVEDDLLGLNSMKPLHGSLYHSLRTNLPRKLMAFRDFPFEAEPGVSQFVSHTLVLDYLERFALHFDLYPVIEFNNPVMSVERVKGGKWSVSSSVGDQSEFDAIIVCNGHYSKPRVPCVQGMDVFEGVLMHSHNYRLAEPFAGKRVAMFGAAASALDLSLEIGKVAEQVYWCAEEHSDIDLGERIERCGAPEQFERRNLKLRNGELITNLDVFIFCTGYHYTFPFLKPGIVDVADNWVYPLYQELIPPEYPTIAFVGLPYAIIPFPLFEIQVKWFTRILAGRFHLPTEGEMRALCEVDAERLKASGKKQRNFHKKGIEQYAYMHLLAEECGASYLPSWFEPLAEEVRLKRLEDPVNYRNQIFSSLMD